MELLWITNIATPYTVPVWRELGKLADLHVVCLAQTESNRKWNVDLTGIDHTFLRARPIKAGAERTLYAPVPGLLALFRRRPAVVVLDGWESPAFWQARMLAKLFGVRVVMSYWSTAKTHRFTSGPVAAFRRWFFRSADGVITPGQAATDAVAAMGVPSDRITTGLGTVDVDHFATQVAALRTSEPSRTGHHFIYAGQLIARKNVHALLHAFSLMLNAGDTLRIVGSGPLDAQLRQSARDFGIQDAVTFSGHLDQHELIKQYAVAQTLVLPSTEEVWGLVINEALASGLHAVVSRTCGAAASVEQLSSVYLCDPGAHSIAASMRASRQDWSGYYSDAAYDASKWSPAVMAKLVMTSVAHPLMHETSLQ